MKFQVNLEVGQQITLGCCSLHGSKQSAQLPEILGVNPLRCQCYSPSLQYRSRRVDVANFLKRKFYDKGASVWDHSHISLLFEEPERISQRRPAYPQALYQIKL